VVRGADDALGGRHRHPEELPRRERGVPRGARGRPGARGAGGLRAGPGDSRGVRRSWPSTPAARLSGQGPGVADQRHRPFVGSEGSPPSRR
jgi:hypothetical protein